MQVLYPEWLGEKVWGKRFYEYAPVDPDEMELGILSHNDLAPFDPLMVQRRDIGAGLRRHSPEVRGHLFQIRGAEFALEEVVEAVGIGHVDARLAWESRRGWDRFLLGQEVQFVVELVDFRKWTVWLRHVYELVFIVPVIDLW